MELFYLKTSNDDSLTVQEKAKSIKFKEILTKGALEKHLEQLIVENPGLLDFSDHKSILDEHPELLIIDRQKPFKKQADLFAIDREGNLVIIEIKRDADDEKNRKEEMEFQAIRYAAASRKMTPQEIIDRFAHYLKDQEVSKKDVDWREEAVSKLCKHLSEEADEEVSEDDLNELLNPMDQQKIYLVAANYEQDVTSACAWLLEHNIKIACFRLRPYKIGDHVLLERERLIPPPELDDFMLDIASATEQSREHKQGTKGLSDKPESCLWADDQENPIPVSTWRDMLRLGIEKSVELGLSEDKLPMSSSLDGNDFYAPWKIKDSLFVDLHGSSDQIRKYLSDMFHQLNKKRGFLQIFTRSGKKIELPE